MRSWIVGMAVVAYAIVSQATAASRKSGPRLDRTFGRAGAVALRVPSEEQPGRSFAPDWQLLDAVADRSGRAYVLWSGLGAASSVLAAYDPEGRLDRGFGDDGVLAFGGLGTFGKVALDSTGRIIVLGGPALAPSPTAPAGVDAVVVRILPDGRLDAEFGIGGVQRQESATRIPKDIASDDLGGVFVLARGPAEPREFVVFRLAPDGMLDRGYGDDGVAVVPRIGAYDLRAHTVDATGRFIAVDWYDTDGDGLPGQYALVGLDASGRPDSALGEQGIHRLDFGTRDVGVTDIGVDAMGRYVVLAVDAAPRTAPLIIRFLSDGTPDQTWSGTADGVREILADGALRDTYLPSLTIDGTSYYADGVRSRHRRRTPPSTVVVRVDEDSEQVWTSRFHSFRNNGSGLDVLSVDNDTVLAWSYLFGRRRPRRLNASLVRLRFD